MKNKVIVSALSFLCANVNLQAVDESNWGFLTGVLMYEHTVPTDFKVRAEDALGRSFAGKAVTFQGPDIWGDNRQLVFFLVPALKMGEYNIFIEKEYFGKLASWKVAYPAQRGIIFDWTTFRPVGITIKTKKAAIKPLAIKITTNSGFSFETSEINSEGDFIGIQDVFLPPSPAYSVLFKWTGSENFSNLFTIKNTEIFFPKKENERGSLLVDENGIILREKNSGNQQR